MLRFITILLLSSTSLCFAQADEPAKLTEVERHIKYLEEKQQTLQNDIERERFYRKQEKKEHAEKFTTKFNQPGLILLLSAAFCSLWAQYTRRSSILWFALGFFLAPMTIIVLLCKSSNDLNNGRMKPWN